MQPKLLWLQLICVIAYPSIVRDEQGCGTGSKFERVFYVQGQWKQVAEHLYRDMDAARIKKDRMEEHYLRQLLWAVSGSDAPPEFYCPISLNIMEEPVVLFQTAVTYDRKSLETWLFAYGSKKCPVSGRALTDTAFVENRPLRSLIEEWKRTQTFGGSVSGCGDRFIYRSHYIPILKCIC